MNFYESIIAIQNLYGNQPTNIGSNLSVGNFFIPGFNQPVKGVKALDLKPSFTGIIEIYGEGNGFLDFFQKDVETATDGVYYISLINDRIKDDLQNSLMSQPHLFGDTQRLLTKTFSYYLIEDSTDNPIPSVSKVFEPFFRVTLNTPGSVKISGWTRYNQKITCEELAVEEDDDKYIFDSSNGLAGISSIEITAAPPYSVTVSMNYSKVMLPYTDFGNEKNTLLATKMDFLNLPYSFNNTDFLNTKFGYNPATTDPKEITAAQGNIRPLIHFNDNNSNDDILQIVAWQNINGAMISTNPNEYLEPKKSLINLIGLPPYSENWVGWKG